MKIMERSKTSILQRNWGTHCSSEFCEKCPFVTLNQRAVGSTPTRLTSFLNDFRP